MTRAEAGRLGGRATVARLGREHMAHIGRRGGLSIASRPGHMAHIGRAGFEATCQKHWGGDRSRFVRRLVELGLMAQDPVPENGAWQFPKRDQEPW